MLDSLAALQPPVKRRKILSPFTTSVNYYAVEPEPTTPSEEESGMDCEDEFDACLDSWHVEWDRYEEGLWWTMRGRV